MNLFIKKTTCNVVKNEKSFMIRPSDLQKCCCIVLYRQKSWQKFYESSVRPVVNNATTLIWYLEN